MEFLGTLNNRRISKAHRIKSDFAKEGASLSYIIEPSLPAPSLTQGSLDEDGGRYPYFSWSPVAGATYYRVFRKRCGSGCEPWQWLFTGNVTDYTDGLDLNHPQSTFSQGVAYKVVAVGPTFIGFESSQLWYYP
ncbi:MAG TPA: hypothetical protein VGD77_05145 [Gemmatimonadaceae bacterium]